MLTRKLLKGGNAESRGWKALLNTAEQCSTPVFSSSEEGARCWESSAEPQPVLWGNSGEQRGWVCGSNRGEDLGREHTMGILEGHGHHQEAANVASGQRMSQNETVVA